jgi:hypothetical protein
LNVLKITFYFFPVFSFIFLKYKGDQTNFFVSKIDVLYGKLNYLRKMKEKTGKK